MKRILSFGLAALLATSLVGCSKSDKDASSGSAEKKELTVFVNGFLTPPEDQQFVREEILPKFEEEFNCKVKLEVYSEADGEKSMQTQIESGNIIADVVMAHSGKMPSYVSNGWVQAITDFTKDLKNRTFVDAFTASTTINGETYFVPTSSDVYLLIAKKDMLKYLPDGADFNKLTYEQFVQFANNAAKGEGKGVTAIPSLPGKNLLYAIGAMGLSQGAAFPAINGAEMTTVWNQIKTMAEANAFVATQNTAGDPMEIMKRGEALISIGHMSPVGNVYQSAPEQYVVAAPPSGSKGIGSIGGAWGLGVVKGSKNVDLAKNFMEYMTRPDVMYDYCIGLGGAIPPVKEVVSKLQSEPQDMIMQKGLDVLNNGVISGVPSANFKDWGAVKKVYEDTFESIVKNKTFTAAELDAAQKKLDELKK